MPWGIPHTNDIRMSGCVSQVVPMSSKAWEPFPALTLFPSLLLLSVLRFLCFSSKYLVDMGLVLASGIAFSIAPAASSISCYLSV